jgi:hypothetical protein
MDEIVLFVVMNYRSYNFVHLKGSSETTNIQLSETRLAFYVFEPFNMQF